MGVKDWILVILLVIVLYDHRATVRSVLEKIGPAIVDAWRRWRERPAR